MNSLLFDEYKLLAIELTADRVNRRLKLIGVGRGDPFIL